MTPAIIHPAGFSLAQSARSLHHSAVPAVFVGIQDSHAERLATGVQGPSRRRTIAHAAGLRGAQATAVC